MTAGTIGIAVAHVRQSAEVISLGVEAALDVKAVGQVRALVAHFIQPKVLSLPPVGLILNVRTGVLLRGSSDSIVKSSSITCRNRVCPLFGGIAPAR